MLAKLIQIRPTSWLERIVIQWLIIAINCLDLVKVRDLTRMAHASRLRSFKHPKGMPKVKI